MLSRIQFTLVETSHPGNIGGVARAMKCMNLSNLSLVSPKTFPDPEAISRAAGAEDVLSKARVFGNIQQAVSDCVFVVGTTARPRSIEWPVVAPRIAAERIVDESHKGPVAVLFGRESSGLTNKEVEMCNLLIRIPATDGYASLNLACAAQVIAYELYLLQSCVSLRVSDRSDPARADSGTVEQFHRHLEQTLHDLDFVKVNPPTKLMRKLVRFFNRAQPSHEEINILRGILSAAQEAARTKREQS